MQFPRRKSPSRDSHFFSAYVAQSVSGASHSPYLSQSFVGLHLIIPANFFSGRSDFSGVAWWKKNKRQTSEILHIHDSCWRITWNDELWRQSILKVKLKEVICESTVLSRKRNSGVATFSRYIGTIFKKKILYWATNYFSSVERDAISSALRATVKRRTSWVSKSSKMWFEIGSTVFPWQVVGKNPYVKYLSSLPYSPSELYPSPTELPIMPCLLPFPQDIPSISSPEACKIHP